jgi:hypothetical protein
MTKDSGVGSSALQELPKPRQHYQRYFWVLKNKRLNVLEIGVGGYHSAGFLEPCIRR